MKRVPAKQKDATEVDYPLRINRYLALRGFATRRGADAMIERGEVFLNGKKAVLGDKVEQNDTVEVARSRKKTTYSYVAYNKPRGIMTHSADEGSRDIRGITKKEVNLKGLFPIGRLDKDSHGLMILTNDGRITDRLLNPSFAHERVYEVKTREKLRGSFREHMERGVDIEGYVTRPAEVEILGEKSFRVILTEGKKHQIRRMVANLHNEVIDLKRIAILGIRLNNLPEGGYRKIEGEELEDFLSVLGLTK